eukprot:4488256-Amphidinium_carterae.1
MVSRLRVAMLVCSVMAQLSECRLPDGGALRGRSGAPVHRQLNQGAAGGADQSRVVCVLVLWIALLSQMYSIGVRQVVTLDALRSTVLDVLVGAVKNSSFHELRSMEDCFWHV